MTPIHSRKTPFFKTKVCPWYFKNRCTRGDECLFAHSSDELRGPPNLAKTSICPNIKKKGSCNDLECSFAHTFNELRGTDDLYKTLLCVRYLKGRCSAGDSCRYAHGESELRAVKRIPVEDSNNDVSNFIQHIQSSDHISVSSKDSSKNENSQNKIESNHHYYKFRDNSDRSQIINESNHHVKINKKAHSSLKNKSYSYSENQWATLIPNESKLQEVELIDKEISHLQELKKKAIASQMTRAKSQKDLVYTATVNLFHNNPPPLSANTSLPCAFKSMSIPNQTDHPKCLRNSLSHNNLLTDTPVFTPSHPQFDYLNEYSSNPSSLSSRIDGNRAPTLTRSSSNNLFSSTKEAIDPHHKVSLQELFYSSLPSTNWVSDGFSSPNSDINTLTNYSSRNTFSSFDENDLELPSYTGHSPPKSRMVDTSMNISGLSSQLGLDKDGVQSRLNLFEPLPGTFLHTLYSEIEDESNKPKSHNPNTCDSHLNQAPKYTPYIF